MAHSIREILSKQLEDYEARDPASLNSSEQTDMEALRRIMELSQAPYCKSRQLADYYRPGVEWGNA